MRAPSVIGFASTAFLFFLATIGCAEHGSDRYGDRDYWYDRPYYGDYRGRYDYDYDRRRHYEEERRRMERERQRLEEERARSHKDRGYYREAPERCPSGFHPGNHRCSEADRKRGCKDMKMPRGTTCNAGPFS